MIEPTDDANEKAKHPDADAADDGAGPSSFEAPAEVEPSADGPDAYDIEDEPAREAPRTADLKCPNCGAEREDERELLCLRCGFNLVTLKVEKTRTGETTEVEEDEEEQEEQAAPVCRPGRGNLRLPMVIGGISLFVLLVGYLAGAGGLFVEADLVTLEDGTKSIPFGTRLAAIGRFLALVVCWCGASMGGLFVLAALTDAKFGDIRLGVTRVVSVILAMRLITLFVSVSNARVEWLMEFPLQAGIFSGLSLLLFEMKPRDTAIYSLLTLAGFVVLYLLGRMLALA